jgi:hypothetical protein
MQDNRALFIGPILISLMLLLSRSVHAEDAPGAKDHPLVTRYPGQTLAWQEIINFRPFRVPVGVVTGYRRIDEWESTEGRVTRSHYVLRGEARSWDEVFLNYRQAFEAAGFEMLASGSSDTRAGPEVGGRQWLDVYLAENGVDSGGEIGTIAAGSASQGGQGAFIARKDRAAGLVHVVVVVEQHASDYVGALIDIIEAKPAETGLVSVNPEAMGRDLEEKGRVVLDGLVFEFDRAVLSEESRPALQAIADYLRAHPQLAFFVVGHTDDVGSLDYNLKLSHDRAESVIAALAREYGIAAQRLQAHGSGPLNPVFSNASDAGRARNRRVELVERRER